jgi:hypothetical protein
VITHAEIGSARKAAGPKVRIRFPPPLSLSQWGPRCSVAPRASMG